MSVEKREMTVLSSDGIHQLMGWVYLPEGEPRGYFQVVHGMTEHIGRYDTFMRRMAEEGFICFGCDHLGHGRTGTPDEWGYIAHQDGWLRLAEDVSVVYRAVKEQYGDLPYILMGHSMGSFIVRVAAQRFVSPERLVVMGTGGPNPISGIGTALIKATKAVRGERKVSMFLQKLTFGSYNDCFQEEDDTRAWLTNDRSVRERYAQDPMCTFFFTNSAMLDLVRLNREANSSACFSAMAGRKILLVSGDQDPVGDNGKGVTAVYRRLTAAGADVQMHLYAGYRHEILNDVSREQVIGDILMFVN